MPDMGAKIAGFGSVTSPMLTGRWEKSLSTEGP
jgi:hypothetical protein